MKNFKKVHIISLLLLSTVLITYGQKNNLDSISVQIEDKMKLDIAIYDYKKLIEDVEEDLKSLQAILKAQNDIPEKVSYSITYQPNKLVSIKPNGPGESIIWENGKQTHNQFNNRCNINSDKYLMQIQFNDIEKLISGSLINELKQVIDSTSTTQGRFTTTYHYSFHGSQLTYNKQFDKISGQKDALSLKGGVGVNLIKNQPVIDLSAEMGFIFSKKGVWKNQYYLSYNQLSIFDENSTINANSFVNIGYRYNLSNTIKNPNWIGIELGYLTIRHGDFFGKNTFKFGVNWEIGKYITISPQLYLSGNSSYPAIRIGFGL